jgi:hypothetical protein
MHCRKSPIPKEIKDSRPSKIYLISQFFIHNDSNRQAEITTCLKKCVDNVNIAQIHLLNEKIYTSQELCLNSDQMKKLKQTNIGKRLTYSDVFDYVEKKHIKGYIILSNIDIFFDETLQNLYTSELSLTKSMYCQLRFDYDKTKQKLHYSKIFGPRGDSQDTWIFHSDFNVPKGSRPVFDFCLGKPGCDNKLTYLLYIIGYKLYNVPYKVKTYHYHATQIRNYDQKDAISAPYMHLFPAMPHNNYKLTDRETAFNAMTLNHTRFDINDENLKLYNFIKKCLDKNENFKIPRITQIENNFSFYLKTIPHDELFENNQFMNIFRVMKNNAGIHITTKQSAIEYSNRYFESFNNAKMYCDWEAYGEFYKTVSESHDWVLKNYKNSVKCWSCALDVFESIHHNPWTHALRGKRILIISSFVESIQKMILNREKIYGVDLFPDCTFVFLKPPQTNGTMPSREWYVELNEFFGKINDIKNDFDVALVSCGGYGNHVVGFIHSIGKSAVYVGGVLQMYFGILGKRWEKDRPDIVKLYHNEFWTSK